MKHTIACLIILTLFSCGQKSVEKTTKIKKVNWDLREINVNTTQFSQHGTTYLSVYSEIYDLTDETKHLLTVTVSMRNSSLLDSLFITKADYYDTHGDLIRSYVESPIYLTPMETVEIVIPRRDVEGGSGGNFIFDWALRNEGSEPLFESIMLWTTGNQGISFLSKGVKL
ncbi:MAG: hypothetical protein CSA36_05260 [Draconibacterium sp.]|nr:MAG: hypothetical protein CSA36_05260 [Draconibacterium sp.]